MLRELRIQNYVIVDEVSLHFSAGLNIITGETGAGKSILIDALSLILGGRASPEDIRRGEEEAALEARFDPIPSSPPIETEGSEWLILKRVLSRSGKSRAYLNGSFVNLSTLEEIGQRLTEIHGQHDHHHLTRIDWQLDLLDAFGHLSDPRSWYEERYLRWSQLLKEQSDLKNLESEGKRQESFLQFQLSEIREARLSPQEEESLEKEERLLKNWEAVLSMAQQAYTLLSDEGGALSRIEEAGKEIKNLQKTLGDAAAELQLWEEAKIRLRELGMLLRDRLEGVEFDPGRLLQVTERLYLIQTLKKKYGVSVEAILDRQKQLEADLSRLSAGETRLQEVEKEIGAIEKEVHAAAEILSKKRFEIKSRLEKWVREELDSLGMEKTVFEILITKIPLSKVGGDRVEFLIAAPGEAPQGLGRVASGGELSRIMLALKVALAGVDPVPTMIFDEVDAGIGGGVAERVGKRLAGLSQNHQVFCITHLPQIACFAKSHYYVEKKVSGKRVATSVKKLSEEERIQELARMLGGMTMTPITLRHAEEMVQSASAHSPSMRSLQTRQSKKERSK